MSYKIIKLNNSKGKCLLFLITILSLIFQGCEKIIEIPPPAITISGSQVFESESLANAAVADIYATMVSDYSPYLIAGALTIYPALSADEINYQGTNPSFLQFSQNDISANNDDIQYAFWNKAYQLIYRTNAGIEGLSKSVNLSQNIKDQLLGEVYFDRAFLYFYLQQIFGDVPLVLTTRDYEGNSKLARSTSDKITKQLISDLSSAKGLLSIKNTTVRPTKLAASSLLARIYLYQKDWHNAEINSSEVINSGVYELEKDLNNTFLANNKEAIWQIAPVIDGINTIEAGIFIPSDATQIPEFQISTILINAFESNDKRKVSWIKYNEIGTDKYYYPFKYKIIPFSSSIATEYTTVLRVAEQYLIRSEARAEQNDVPDAISDLDMIRDRAGLTLISSINPSISQIELLNAIKKENQVEFFCEWGHRWLDLKRLNLANSVLGSYKPTWQSTDSLYPIPQGQILLNGNLTQNPGYSK